MTGTSVAPPMEEMDVPAVRSIQTLTTTVASAHRKMYRNVRHPRSSSMGFGNPLCLSRSRVFVSEPADTRYTRPCLAILGFRSVVAKVFARDRDPLFRETSFVRSCVM